MLNPTAAGGKVAMTGREAEFDRLLEEVRNGSQEAAQQFVEEFGPAILRVIRRRLERRMRSAYDSCDFVQDVFASFFRAPPSQDTFLTLDALRKYLETMAQRKVADATRKRLIHQAANLNRENSLDGSAQLRGPGTDRPGAHSQRDVRDQ